LRYNYNISNLNKWGIHCVKSKPIEKRASPNNALFHGLCFCPSDPTEQGEAPGLQIKMTKKMERKNKLVIFDVDLRNF